MFKKIWKHIKNDLEKDRQRKANAKPNPKLNLILLSIFALFLIVGLFYSVKDGVSKASLIYQQTKWLKTSCVVNKTLLFPPSSDNKKYRLKIFYSYNINKKKYQGNEVTSDNYSECLRIKQILKERNKIHCYVNPVNVSKSYLWHTLWWTKLILPLLIFILVSISSIVIYYGIKSECRQLKAKKQGIEYQLTAVQKKQKKLWSKVLIISFDLFFVLLIALTLFFGLKSCNYKKVPCEIIEISKLNTENINLLYKYHYNGKEYFSQRFKSGLNDTFSPRYKDKKYCYVDSNNSQKSVLHKGLWVNDWHNIIIGLYMIYMTLIPILFKKIKQQKKSWQISTVVMIMPFIIYATLMFGVNSYYLFNKTLAYGLFALSLILIFMIYCWYYRNENKY